MTHPLERIPSHYRARLVVIFGVTVAVLIAAFTYFGRGLQTLNGDPAGLFLQLAGDPLVADAIVSGWSPPQQVLAQNLLVLDFTFLVCYAMLFALGCLWASAVWPSRRVASIGISLAWAQWVAAVLDAIENVALLTVTAIPLDSSVTTLPNAFAVSAARFCSLGKFVLIAAGLVYIGLAAIYHSGVVGRGRQPVPIH